MNNKVHVGQSLQTKNYGKIRIVDSDKKWFYFVRVAYPYKTLKQEKDGFHKNVNTRRKAEKKYYSQY